MDVKPCWLPPSFGVHDGLLACVATGPMGVVSNPAVWGRVHMSLFNSLGDSLGHMIHGIGHSQKTFFHGSLSRSKGYSMEDSIDSVSAIPLFLSSVACVESAMYTFFLVLLTIHERESIGRAKNMLVLFSVRRLLAGREGWLTRGSGEICWTDTNALIGSSWLTERVLSIFQQN
ncbi:hypothetical protein Pyn_37596 [Prunus yedoensis var. nudiflora]|uniref:Uncharacterized protein n=1 Tax=Prunus yedoensis var. nudiflora TaxID=2094558 RepID=A0A314Z914_PRUYE|nr:hypothetical protein Pyn_37596 [Prunus yedoensis var. nudiflora]